MIEDAFVSGYQRDGYVIARGLFTSSEVQHFVDHFMAMRAGGPRPGDFPDYDPASENPLQRFPRMIHMHRWDELSWRFFIDPRLTSRVAALLGGEPNLVQTMVYFKPPGSRGQAPHQDQFYFRAAPGSTMGAWLALDRADEENGCMRMVPGSHRYPLICTVEADRGTSFTEITSPLPPGIPFPAQVMHPGDVLFFEGHVVHGSFPNATSDRFRRALIAHYISPEATRIGEDYHPVLDRSGSPVAMGVSPEGGSCHEWVERAGGWQLIPCDRPETRSGTRRASERGGRLDP